MKRLPDKFLESLEDIEGFDKENFVKVHESGEQITSIRINPTKTATQRQAGVQHIDDSLAQDTSPIDDSIFTSGHSLFSIAGPVPWSQFGFYLKERPSFTFDPLFHAGCYYVQDASSMFLEQALKQLVDMSKPIKVLDLCAAPGGKSTHIQSLISSESLLVSNEVIRSRNNILVDNILRWGCNNVIVSNNDPSAFQRLEGFFDVMVVDAPCSGSGLFRKDREAIDEWSFNNVQLCSQRQQRILGGSLASLKEGGILVYSTCSYSREEDEEILDWLLEEFKMESLPLDIQQSWNIVKTHSSKGNATAYRFYPDKLMGEGLFLACFRKTSSVKELKHRSTTAEKPSKKELEIMKHWIRNDHLELIKDLDSFFLLPSQLVQEYSVLRSILNIRYKGVGIGQIMKDRLVPEHSLALSTIISQNIPFNELSYGEAIKYLQRQDVNVSNEGKGWQLVGYKGYNLGWINVLPNRINNYYPKELRILKQQNDSAFGKY